jgi:hypothetical protein
MYPRFRASLHLITYDTYALHQRIVSLIAEPGMSEDPILTVTKTVELVDQRFI